jgi:hypothetical protein
MGESPERQSAIRSKDAADRPSGHRQANLPQHASSPDKQARAATPLLEQAEVLCREWATE